MDFDNNLSPVEPSFTKCAVMQNTEDSQGSDDSEFKDYCRPGGLDGISSVKIAEKVKLFSERCNCVS